MTRETPDDIRIYGRDGLKDRGRPWSREREGPDAKRWEG